MHDRGATGARAPGTEYEAVSVRIRVGVHTGEVIAAGDDMFGRHVMMTARDACPAAGRAILVSALVYEIAWARGIFDSVSTAP